MIIGFTGTRNGMTVAQRERVWELIQFNRASMGIHGGCLGADAHFHELCFHFDIPIEIYPGYSAKNPDDLSMRAELLATKTHEPMTHFARNRAIVERCNMMIACPATRYETRGGTWYTINHARKVGRPLCVVYPDGSTSE